MFCFNDKKISKFKGPIVWLLLLQHRLEQMIYLPLHMIRLVKLSWLQLDNFCYISIIIIRKNMPLLFWLGGYTDMDLYWSQVLFGKNLHFGFLCRHRRYFTVIMFVFVQTNKMSLNFRYWLKLFNGNEIHLLWLFNKWKIWYLLKNWKKYNYF